MIRHAEISKLAYQAGLGEKTIEKDYVLTWLLHAIAKSPLADSLVFKGGTAIKKIYIPDYRYSEDLDFTVLELDAASEKILDLFTALYPWLAHNVNLQVAFERLETHQSGNFTLYLNYAGPLQAQLSRRVLKIDISLDETLVFPAVQKRVQSPYTDCESQNEPIKVYTMEEILIEKLRSLITRTEPRDLFDVHYILSHHLADIDAVRFNCQPKFRAKGLQTSDLNTVLDRKNSIFMRHWQQRLEGQMSGIPEYGQVVRETRRFISSMF